MYGFEFGAHKTRKINLGGITNQQDKKMLLKNTLAERKQRQENKLKNKSATKIQAFWRGRKEFEELKRNLMKEWKKECKEIINNPEDCEIENVISIFRKFLIFYKSRNSRVQDLIFMCKTLLTKKDDSVEIILLPLSDDDYIKDSINQLRMFIPYCIKGIPGLESEKQSYIFNIIQILMNIHNQPKDVIYPYEKENIHKDILNIIMDAGLFNMINTLYYNIAFVVNNDDNKIKQELKKLDLFSYSIFFLEMKNKLDTKKLYKSFIVDIFTIPALPNRFDIKGIMKFASSLPYKLLLEYINSNLDDIVNYIKNEASIYPNNNLLVNLLSNIVAFGRSLILKGPTSLVVLYIAVINKILDEIPTRYFISDDQKNLLFNHNESDNESSDEEDFDEEGDENKEKIDEMDEEFILDKNVLKWIKFLWNRGDAYALYSKIINSNSNSNTINQEIILFCKLYLSLILKIPAYSNEILSILLYTKNINLLSSLWEYANNSSLVNEILNQTSINKLISNENYSTEWYILSLFCKMLNTQLLTMGDDEFFSEQYSLNINNIIKISKIVRNISYMIYMNYDNLNDEMLIKNSNITIANMKSIFPQLLRQLYTRDSRKKFTKENIWIMISENEQDNLIRTVWREENKINNNEDNSQNNNNEFEFESTFSGGIFSNDQSFLFNQNTNEIISPTERETVKDKFYKNRVLILKHIPFIIPFEVRVNMFRAMIEQDKRNRTGPFEWSSPVTRATIRRDRIFEDGYDQLNSLGSNLRQKVQISFINEQGLPEAGIDGGGVFKEFLTSITHQAFDMNYGLFLSTSNQCLYPNPHSYARQDERLRYYEFLGRILGKALYEGILVDVFFASFFLSKWVKLGGISYLDDLPSLDEELYKGLLYIKNYKGDIRDLSLTFSIDDEQFGVAKSIDLIANGSSIPVTDENKIQYIYHMANYKLNTQIYPQCKAFFRGLSDLIEPRWLQMFNQQELQTLISGSNSASVDIIDLKMNTEYSGVYDENHPTIKLFWQVVNDLSEEQKRKLIKFVTSCPRPPLLGFKTLQPKFAIRDSGNDQERLPTSSTCINLLKLPVYRTYDVMKSKLIYSISSDSGFELS